LTNPQPYTIAVVPIGHLKNELLGRTKREICRVFQCQTEVIPHNQDLNFALDPARSQYHSTVILEKLALWIPPHIAKAVAIAEVDLFIPIFTHVYGEAQMGGKTCIVSTFRLKEGLSQLDGNQIYSRRVIKESIHELGHTFNLRHCPDQVCIMHYCRTLMDVDRKSHHMCRYCQVLLEDETKRLAKYEAISPA
jgi:archaemetzincin